MPAWQDLTCWKPLALTLTLALILTVASQATGLAVRRLTRAEDLWHLTTLHLLPLARLGFPLLPPHVAFRASLHALTLLFSHLLVLDLLLISLCDATGGVEPVVIGWIGSRYPV